MGLLGMRKINLIGQRFGRLIVVEGAPNHKGGQARWVCRCDCGNETVNLSANLRGKGAQSCGCLSRERARETMALLREKKNRQLESDLLGHKFNRLTVIRFYDFDPSQRAVKRWLTVCDCGKEVIVRTNALVMGRTKSCGCWRTDSRKLELGLCMRNHLLATYQAAAKRRGYEWGLSNDEFFEITQQPCHYCGSPPSERRGSKRYNGGYICNGVDRKDNSLGYIPGNVLPACKDCNYMKKDKTYDEFISYLRRAGRFQLKVIAIETSV